MVEGEGGSAAPGEMLARLSQACCTSAGLGLDTSRHGRTHEGGERVGDNGTELEETVTGFAGVGISSLQRPTVNCLRERGLLDNTGISVSSKMVIISNNYMFCI